MNDSFAEGTKFEFGEQQHMQNSGCQIDRCDIAFTYNKIQVENQKFKVRLLKADIKKANIDDDDGEECNGNRELTADSCFFL